VVSIEGLFFFNNEVKKIRNLFGGTPEQSFYMHHSHFDMCGMFNRTLYTWLNISEIYSIYYGYYSETSCQVSNCVRVMCSGPSNGF